VVADFLDQHGVSGVRIVILDELTERKCRRVGLKAELLHAVLHLGAGVVIGVEGLARHFARGEAPLEHALQLHVLEAALAWREV